MTDSWYFLLPAILAAIIPSREIEEYTKKRIPNDQKRAKINLVFLISMAVFFSVILFLITDAMPIHIRITLSAVPIAGVGIGVLIAKLFKKAK